MLFRGYLVRYLQGMMTWVFFFRRSTVRTYSWCPLFSFPPINPIAFFSLLVKNGLTHVGGGFSACEFHIVPVKKEGRVASVDEFPIVPVKKEGRRSLGR